MPLTVGKKSPSFALKDKDGKVHRLEDLPGRYTVVYFYPKDDTPGCTIEAMQFTGAKAALKKLGASVVGISGGDARSKAAFCKKHGLRLTLLSDPNFAVAKRFGAYGKKRAMGRTYTGILRKTFVLDDSQKVVKIFDEVKADGHAQEVIKFITAEKKRSAKLSARKPASTRKSRPSRVTKAAKPAKPAARKKSVKAATPKRAASKVTRRKATTARQAAPAPKATTKRRAISTGRPVRAKATPRVRATARRAASRRPSTRAARR